jgi:hypothetical protein
MERDREERTVPRPDIAFRATAESRRKRTLAAAEREPGETVRERLGEIAQDEAERLARFRRPFGTAIGSRPQAGSTPPPMAARGARCGPFGATMQRWEYLVVPLEEARKLKKDFGALHPATSNELGAEGWEAVGVSLKQGDLVAWPLGYSSGHWT